VDFFISYTAADRAWAEWIAWQLEAGGFTTVLQAWDFRPGTDFVHQMQQAVQQADRTIAVLSPTYFGSQLGEAEWRVAFAKDPSGQHGLLLPVRVADCHPLGLLATRVYIDLVGMDETTARERLLSGVQEGRRWGLPKLAPAFPGFAATPADQRPAPVFPGTGTRISLPLEIRTLLAARSYLRHSLRVLLGGRPQYPSCQHELRRSTPINH
jgi:hypothetical protein